MTHSCTLLSLNRCWDCLEQCTSNTKACKPSWWSTVWLWFNPAVASSRICIRTLGLFLQISGEQSYTGLTMAIHQPSRYLSPAPLLPDQAFPASQFISHNGQDMNYWCRFGGSFPDGGQDLIAVAFPEKNPITVSLQLRIPQIISTQQSKQTNMYRAWVQWTVTGNVGI